MQKCIGVVFALGLAAAVAQAQNQPPVSYARAYCIKVNPGKIGEFNAYVHDVAGKLMRAHEEEHHIAAGLMAQAVIPAGTSARCDYQAVYFYQGALPEAFTEAETNAALKRADLNMTAADLGMKRESISRLVSVDISRAIDAVPMNLVNNEYIRLNYFKVKPGKMNEWIDLEKSGWKPLIAEHVKSGAVTGWFLQGIIMPTGDRVRANAFTVDTFPDWASLMKGIPLSTLWSKVHPNQTSAAYMEQIAAIAERPSVEVMRVVEAAVPKATGSN
jgi:hypothetical protein